MRILIISVSNLKKDPRVYRQIGHLSKCHSVTCIGLADPEIDGVEFYRIPDNNPMHMKAVNGMALLFRRYGILSKNFPAIHRLGEEFAERPFDLIIANDTNTLSFACAVKNGAKLVFDAHEYAPREFEESLKWKLFMQPYQYYLLREYLGSCDRVLTVCDGIADEFQREYGVRPDVITNASEYQDLKPSPVDPDHIRIIHHGGASAQRRLEKMIEVMDHLDDRFSLDLMLVVPDKQSEYFEYLQRLVSTKKNVRIVSPVPMTEIARTINQYDIGLYILEPSAFNDYYSLPNKLFEFVQARLAIAIGPSVEMARIVKEHHLGIVSESYSPTEMAERLGALTVDEIECFKRHSDRAALPLSSQHNLERMDCIVQELTQ